MIRFFSERKAFFILEVVVSLALIFSLWALYQTQTLEPGEKVVVPGGATVAKPSNNIVDARVGANGRLLLEYDDGTIKEAGSVVGPKGERGESIAPTQAQIAAALVTYCSVGNRCDAQSPTTEQVALAVQNYCSSRNECRGEGGETGAAGERGAAGADGQNASAEMVAAAVANYCADGRCVGATGATGASGAQGQTGPSGRTPVISCVIRDGGLNGTRWLAYKYEDESEDSAYRDIYTIPALEEANNCVDLRT